MQNKIILYDIKNEPLTEEIIKKFWENIRILSSDDMPINEILQKRFFLSEGCTEKNIIFTKNGKEFIKEVSQSKKQIDIFLLDYNMPQVTGVDALKIVRRNPKYKNTPAILITAYDNEEIKTSINEHLFQLLINKPFKFNMFTNVIPKLFSNEKIIEIASRDP
ncbi:response regulator [Candidatus Margulisiibacteriota bacterium]